MSHSFPLKAVKQFFQNKRAMFASLQEMSFERGEKKLIELLHSEKEPIDYPIPTFIPILLVWLFIILFPLVLILDPGYLPGHEINTRNMIGFYLPLIMTLCIFQINQKILVPSCIFKKLYARYFIFNAVLIGIALFIREIVFFIIERSSKDSWEYFFHSYCFSFVKGHFSLGTCISFAVLVSLVCIICVIYHIMIRQILRTFIRREQKRAELQYELDFLKNQLSPHFLFNTLNNISALVQIDPKRAESSIDKLSKLLRVTLYQTSEDLITIKEEVDILQKYADLEKLRLDDSFDFKFEVSLENPNAKIAPLIAMPLMENAIKHSLNPNGKSFAHISIIQTHNEFFFKAVNSNFPRKSQPKMGGLGLSTFKKRLDLLYLDKYSYTTSIQNGTYISNLKITIVSD